MRQIVLDTETTGLSVSQGHRIIEIGCVELVNRRLTGRDFHCFLNPDRDIEEGAERVHGINNADLETAPRFPEVADDLLEFITDEEATRTADLAYLNAVADLAEARGYDLTVDELTTAFRSIAVLDEDDDVSGFGPLLATVFANTATHNAITVAINPFAYSADHGFVAASAYQPLGFLKDG